MESAFNEAELAYLHGQRRLGRVATVGSDATPHVVPVGWRHNTEHDTIDIGGRGFAETKKFKDVARSGRAAIVIDDLASVDPWRPRAVEVRGRAEALYDPDPLIRIYPERVVSWGLASTATRVRSRLKEVRMTHDRDVGESAAGRVDANTTPYTCRRTCAFQRMTAPRAIFRACRYPMSFFRPPQFPSRPMFSSR